MAGYGMGTIGDAILTGGKAAFDTVNKVGAAVKTTAQNMVKDASAMVNKPSPPLVDRRQAEVEKIVGK
jgi:hypothetical protein